MVPQPENNATERKIKALFPMCIDGSRDLRLNSSVNCIGMGGGDLVIRWDFTRETVLNQAKDLRSAEGRGRWKVHWKIG